MSILFTIIFMAFILMVHNDKLNRHKKNIFNWFNNLTENFVRYIFFGNVFDIAFINKLQYSPLDNFKGTYVLSI